MAFKMVCTHMLSKHFLAAAIVAGLVSASWNTSYAQQAPAVQAATTLPFVSPIFADNMVLQRNKPDKIWGWSQPGDAVHVVIGSSTASAVAGADHRWQVEIQPPPTGGPYTVKITGRQSLELHNVLVGDVWLCGGQSNMEFKLRGVLNSADEVKAANYPGIRFLTVGEHAAYHHTDLVSGTWTAVSPETAAQVSAVAYYFARRVQQNTHIPIGLVIDAVGGTPAETWTSLAALRQLGGLDVPLAELERVAAENGPEYGNYVMSWFDRYDVGTKENWSNAGLDDGSWKSVDIFGSFAALGVPDTPAVIWLRKEVVLPNSLPPGRAMIFLGIVDRMDTVYVNAKFIGGSAWVENPRVYHLGDDVLKPGKNVFVIRVLKTGPKGGFLGKPEDLHLVLGDKTNVSLAGEWKGKLSVDARPPHPLPISYENWPVMPSVLYQGMLEPIAPLSITGAIWYQGEANAKRGFEYRKVLPAMIADWRKLFGQGDFPFYIVSLPAFGQRSTTPVDDAWAETRESQAITASTVPDTCLAVTIDTGDPDTIHPKDKIPVGDRLAYCALAKNYGENIPSEGPAFTSFDVLSLAIRLHFAHAEGGLVIKGDKPEEFSIAGDDHKWYWADAHIFGDTVVVSSSAVPNPKAVRYAWQSNPAATLYNKAGLPAVPFRTDSWPGLTDSKPPY
jgi:sialate O-acetylesterase